MSTNSKEARFRKDMLAVAEHRKELQKPQAERNPHKMLKPRDLIKIRLRCRLCGRSRAVYRKFGVCRICLRDMASDALIPGMRKSSW